jgi:hypothetical protein
MKKAIILILIAAGALALALYAASYFAYLTVEHRVSRQFHEQEQQQRIARKTQELMEARTQMTQDVIAEATANSSDSPALYEKFKIDMAREERLEKELAQLGGTDPEDLAQKERQKAAASKNGGGTK